MATWTLARRESLLESAIGGGYSPDQHNRMAIWNKILKVFKKKQPDCRHFTVEHIQSQLRMIESDYKTFHDVRSCKELMWDPESERVLCPDAIWVKYVQRHPKAKIFKDQGMEFADLCEELFDCIDESDEYTDNSDGSEDWDYDQVSSLDDPDFTVALVLEVIDKGVERSKFMGDLNQGIRPEDIEYVAFFKELFKKMIYTGVNMRFIVDKMYNGTKHNIDYTTFRVDTLDEADNAKFVEVFVKEVIDKGVEHSNLIKKLQDDYFSQNGQDDVYSIFLKNLTKHLIFGGIDRTKIMQCLDHIASKEKLIMKEALQKSVPLNKVSSAASFKGDNEQDIKSALDKQDIKSALNEQDIKSALDKQDIKSTRDKQKVEQGNKNISTNVQVQSTSQKKDNVEIKSTTNTKVGLQLDSVKFSNLAEQFNEKNPMIPNPDVEKTPDQSTQTRLKSPAITNHFKLNPASKPFMVATEPANLTSTQAQNKSIIPIINPDVEKTPDQSTQTRLKSPAITNHFKLNPASKPFMVATEPANLTSTQGQNKSIIPIINPDVETTPDQSSQTRLKSPAITNHFKLNPGSKPFMVATEPATSTFSPIQSTQEGLVKSKAIKNPSIRFFSSKPKDVVIQDPKPQAPPSENLFSRLVNIMEPNHDISTIYQVWKGLNSQPMWMEVFKSNHLGAIEIMIEDIKSSL